MYAFSGKCFEGAALEVHFCLMAGGIGSVEAPLWELVGQRMDDDSTGGTGSEFDHWQPQQWLYQLLLGSPEN